MPQLRFESPAVLKLLFACLFFVGLRKAEAPAYPHLVLFFGSGIPQNRTNQTQTHHQTDLCETLCFAFYTKNWLHSTCHNFDYKIGTRSNRGHKPEQKSQISSLGAKQTFKISSQTKNNEVPVLDPLEAPSPPNGNREELKGPAAEGVRSP